MREFVPAWKRRKIDEQEARRNAPPVAAHVLANVINTLGRLQPHQKQMYFDELLRNEILTEEQLDYVKRVAAGVLL